MFSSLARVSEPGGVQKRPSNMSSQPVEGRRERHRQSLLPKKLEEIPEQSEQPEI